jgi:hypothetical protein
VSNLTYSSATVGANLVYSFTSGNGTISIA